MARKKATGGLATQHAQADESPGFLLWQVTNRWQSAQRAALKPFDITHVQFVLLASLTWLGTGGTDGTVSQRELAQHAATDPMMTSQVLRVLETRGLVARAPHPTDGRAWSLQVTARGRSLAYRAVLAVEACDDAFFAPLGSRSKDLAALLREVINPS